MSAMTAAILVLALQTAQSAAVGTPAQGLPLEGAAAEEFLKTAKIRSVGNFPTHGVTRPKKVELSDGERTLFAVFKTIDEYAQRKEFPDGDSELNFSDSWKYEIAAYELDKLLGLGIVPPVVNRWIQGNEGSLSLWVEGSMTEWERVKVKKISAPDTVAWNNQMYTVRLFLQLIYDVDYKNVNNLLVTQDWKVYKIDSSRSFRNHKKLFAEESLGRFSRTVLASLRQMTMEQLEGSLSQWLSKRQIKALWVRRGLILELADQMVEENGEDTVLFD